MNRPGPAQWPQRPGGNTRIQGMSPTPGCSTEQGVRPGKFHCFGAFPKAILAAHPLLGLPASLSPLSLHCWEKQLPPALKKNTKVSATIALQSFSKNINIFKV